MEHLTKQQIILLTLFTSFVTSIATGIVTVSLMNQAPAGVTQTINQVIEKTIEKVIPSQNTGTVSQGVQAQVQTQDQLSLAIDKVQKSIVKVKSKSNSGSVIEGVGIVVSKEGVVIVDKSIIPPPGNATVTFFDGQEFDAQIMQVQTNGDIAFILVKIPDEKKSKVSLIPMNFVLSIKLGQAVAVLYGKDMDMVAQGIVEKIDGDTTSSVDQIKSVTVSTPNLKSVVGSPLFTLSGEIIGIKTISFVNEDSNAFYPINLIKYAIPVFKK